METSCKKVISILKDNCIPKATDDEAKVFYLKMIGDYYRNTTKTGWRKKFKDSKNLIKFRFKVNQKAFAFLILRPPKIKAKEFFTLIGFGTWIGQVDVVCTGIGTGNWFSPGSKPRLAITFILFTLMG